MINSDSTTQGQQHRFLAQSQYPPTSVSYNPSSVGRLCHNKPLKLEEWVLGPYHSPRGPHKRKTLPRQSAGITIPPHPEQCWKQRRQHSGGLQQHQKIMYTPPTDQQNR